MLATLLELSSVAARSVTFGEAQAAQAPAATELTGVEVGRNADGVTVTIKGNGKLAYGTLQEADRPPLRLVVDFPGVRPERAAGHAWPGRAAAGPRGAQQRRIRSSRGWSSTSTSRSPTA